MIVSLERQRGNILKKKNLKEIKKTMVSDRDNYMWSFRKNVFAYLEGKETTLNHISEEADIPFSTLKTFLYGDSKDCNLSTAVKLARALGISIDRLVGAETIDKDILNFSLAYKDLPKASQGLIKWHLENQIYLHEQHHDTKEITVMIPECNGNGNLQKTSEYAQIDVTDIGEEYLHKVFFGIKIPCEHYLPKYKEGDILLIANDRDAIHNEHTVILINDNLIITKRVVEDGVAKYYGIRDNIFRSEHKDYVQVIGYIAKVIEGE